MKPRALIRQALILIAGLLLFASFVRAAGAACPIASEQRAMVSSITERGEVLLADGRVARLAGLDVPDAGRGDPANAANARAWLSSRLVGREIGLRALAAKPDRWGRLLADLSVADGAAASESVSLGLLSAGLARVRPEAEARNCLEERFAAEQAARADGLGVWTDPYYGVVEATDLDELRQRDGEFAIVEGVVLRVGEGRNRTYLDFGRRGSFTIVLTARQTKAFERLGVAVAALAGVRIRARGAMDNRFGLRMTISEPDEIERISPGSGKSEAKPDK